MQILKAIVTVFFYLSISTSYANDPISRSSEYDPSLPEINLNEIPESDEIPALLSEDMPTLELDAPNSLLSDETLTLEDETNLLLSDDTFTLEENTDSTLLLPEEEVNLDEELSLEYTEDSPDFLNTDPIATGELQLSDDQIADFEAFDEALGEGEALSDLREDWVIEKGITLKTLLENWCERAGWTLIWDTPKQQRMAANGNIYGTFEEAVDIVFSSLRQANSPFTAERYLANNVLRIRPR